jgi:hypothetical protein
MFILFTGFSRCLFIHFPPRRCSMSDVIIRTQISLYDYSMRLDPVTGRPSYPNGKWLQCTDIRARFSRCVAVSRALPYFWYHLVFISLQTVAVLQVINSVGTTAAFENVRSWTQIHGYHCGTTNCRTISCRFRLMKSSWKFMSINFHDCSSMCCCCQHRGELALKMAGLQYVEMWTTVNIRRSTQKAEVARSWRLKIYLLTISDESLS